MYFWHHKISISSNCAIQNNIKDMKIQVKNSRQGLFFSDLPIYSYWRTVVVSQHASTVAVHTTFGITLHCKKGISMCRIHLDENTMNKTLGLLGTNDNEQANDKRMRNNEVRPYTYLQS